jgi:predicted dehydrogenase
MIIDAVNANKHVYCEKPMAMNLSEAREMLEAAEKSGVVHQVTFHNRFSPAMLRAKQLVDEGFLGQPMSFRVAYLHSGYVDPNRPMSWRLDKKQSGGGALYDLGSHAIDLIRYLLGDCTKVFASLHTFIKKRPVKSTDETIYADVEVDDLAILQMNTQNGAVGTIEASRIATGSTDELLVDVHGTQGALHFNLMDANWLYAYDARAKSEPLGGMQGYTRVQTIQKYPQPAVFPSSKASIGWMRLHVASLYDFVTNVVRGEVGEPSFLDGVKTQEIMEAALISAEQGKWVDLPLN